MRRYSGLKGWNSAGAIAVDAQDNVLVTGESSGDGTDLDYATVKYSPAGQRLWVRRYNGPVNGWDTPTAIGLDSQNNVYITGFSEATDKFECATIKYGPDGRRLWLRRYSGTGFNGAYGLAVDAQANVLITGCTFIDGKGYGYLTIKYSQTP